MVVADKVRENDIQEIFADAGSVRLAFGSSSFPQCRNQKLEIDRVNREPQRGKFLRNGARRRACFGTLFEHRSKRFKLAALEASELNVGFR